MAFVVIDKTTKSSKLNFYRAVINGRLFRFFYTGKAKTVDGKVDTYLKLPHTRRPLQQGKVANSISAAQVRLAGAGLDSHYWDTYHVRHQQRALANHLDLLIVLPRKNADIVSLKFTKLGNLDFLHHDAKKLYLGIQLYDHETVRILTDSGCIYYTAKKTDGSWSGHEYSSAEFSKQPSWRSTQTITI